MRRLEQGVTVLTIQINLPICDEVYSGKCVLLIRADSIRSNFRGVGREKRLLTSP